MRSIEIYNLTPAKIMYDTAERFFRIFQHIKNEPAFNDIDYSIISEIEREHKIAEYYYLDEGDDKYGGQLSAIYFEEKPVVIVKTDGRYYENHQVFLTDLEQFNNIKKYIFSKLEKVVDEIDVYSIHDDIKDLNVVNNYRLEDYYNPNLKPKYKVDDIVWAYVKENHLSYTSEDYVLTRVKIHGVSDFNTKRTYGGIQLDRLWGENHIMKYEKNKGMIGCTLNDDLIIGKVNEIPMPNDAIDNK